MFTFIPQRMLSRIFRILFAVFVLVSIQRCAQIAPLTGGQRDTTPPRLTEAEPVNGTVNFKGNRISLSFDEFVQLRDLPNQLLISPRMKEQPEISALGKKIEIRLKPEELLPNTTYRFSFGKAVA